MKKLLALILSICLVLGCMAFASAETKTGSAQGFASEVKVTAEVEDGKIILLDYKTDRAQKGDEQSLVNRYRKQFELYAAALERLLGMNVTQAWLYSLSLGEAIRVPL